MEFADVDYELVQGNTFHRTYKIKINGSFVADLTGYIFRLNIARDWQDLSSDTPNPITSDFPISFTELAQGDTTAIVGNITENISKNIPVGKWVYDLEVIFPSGAVKTFRRGRFIVYGQA
jgi:hypothetical protein